MIVSLAPVSRMQGKDCMMGILKKRYRDHTVITFDARGIWRSDPDESRAGRKGGMVVLGAVQPCNDHL